MWAPREQAAAAMHWNRQPQLAVGQLRRRAAATATAATAADATAAAAASAAAAEPAAAAAALTTALAAAAAHWRQQQRRLRQQQQQPQRAVIGWASLERSTARSVRSWQPNSHDSRCEISQKASCLHNYILGRRNSMLTSLRACATQKAVHASKCSFKIYERCLDHPVESAHVETLLG